MLCHTGCRAGRRSLFRCLLGSTRGERPKAQRHQCRHPSMSLRRASGHRQRQQPATPAGKQVDWQLEALANWVCLLVRVSRAYHQRSSSDKERVRSPRSHRTITVTATSPTKRSTGCWPLRYRQVPALLWSDPFAERDGLAVGQKVLGVRRPGSGGPGAEASRGNCGHEGRSPAGSEQHTGSTGGLATATIDGRSKGK